MYKRQDRYTGFGCKFQRTFLELSGIGSFTAGSFREYSQGKPFLDVDVYKRQGKGVAAGTAKTLDYMKTEEFYKEIKGNGGDYIYNPGGTPVFPALKYSCLLYTSRDRQRQSLETVK